MKSASRGEALNATLSCRCECSLVANMVVPSSAPRSGLSCARPESEGDESPGLAGQPRRLSRHARKNYVTPLEAYIGVFHLDGLTSAVPAQRRPGHHPDRHGRQPLPPVRPRPTRLRERHSRPDLAPLPRRDRHSAHHRHRRHLCAEPAQPPPRPDRRRLRRPGHHDPVVERPHLRFRFHLDDQAGDLNAATRPGIEAKPEGSPV